MAKTPVLERALDDQPEVAELKMKLAEAQAELVAAEGELNALNRILNPLAASSEHTPNVSEIDHLRAGQQMPIAHARYIEAKAAVLELKPRYETIRAEAVRQLTDARNRARLPLLRRFANALEAAKAIGDEIQNFDHETRQLGGAQVAHPCAWLIDELPFRYGECWRVSRLVEELERS